MTYECKDKYLCASLLSFNGFKLIDISIQENKILYLVDYKNKTKLFKLIEQYVNKTLSVDFEKYKSNLTLLDMQLISDK